MRILLVHNFYRQAGGEDSVFRAERDLLRHAGHEVVELTAHNDELGSGSGLPAAVGAFWNRQFCDRLRSVCQSFRPEIAHFHNTLAVVSPGALRVARKEGAAVVQTLHNYRMACPSGLLFRDSKPCESCVGKSFPWTGVAKGCYRGSRAATATVGAVNLLHHWMGTWGSKVDRFIALTEFARSKVLEAGLPAHSVAVKPNFVPDHVHSTTTSGGVLFVGRLSEEKGVRTLIEAASRLEGFSIRIAGTGPLSDLVARAAADMPWVTWLGQCSREQIDHELDRASCLAFPSLWYEGMPMTILESLAASVPVVASRIGAIPEIVSHGDNGLLFDPGNAGDLAEQLQRVLTAPELEGRLAQGARSSYEARFTGRRCLEMLESIYDEAVALRHQRRRAS